MSWITPYQFKSIKKSGYKINFHVTNLYTCASNDQYAFEIIFILLQKDFHLSFILSRRSEIYFPLKFL